MFFKIMDVIVRLVNSDYDLTLSKFKTSCNVDDVVVDKDSYLLECMDLNENQNNYIESDNLSYVYDKFLAHAFFILGKSY